MTAADTIRIVCPHGEHATFTRRKPGGPWATAVSGVDPAVTGRNRYQLRCDPCRLTVVVASTAKLTPILDALWERWPGERTAPNTVEIPLKVLADALGRGLADHDPDR